MRLVLIPLCTLIAGMSMTAYAAPGFCSCPPRLSPKTSRRRQRHQRSCGRCHRSGSFRRDHQSESQKGVYYSDENGEFKIVTKNKREVITCSSIGYVSQIVTVFPGNTTTIPLSEDNTALGEVVVTGFVNKAKSSFTGSETTVKKEQLLSVGTKNVLESLQSFVPGLVIPETTSPVRTPTRSPNSASAAAPRSTARPTCRSSWWTAQK